MKVRIETHKDTARVFINGLEVKDLSSYQVLQGKNEFPQLILEYACYEQLTIDGEMEIEHVCPKGGRNKK